ncbi:hypothetical protein DFH11DRAFT_1581912 [Phellopilus nigrolimitatus]|nr:hypothetical protein DFH11DRAFT_1581912 [Phellopilus nigrolimitatus]
MDVNLLGEKHAELAGLFKAHAAQTRALRAQALQEIVPDVVLQMALGADEEAWVADYLRDLGSLFRMFRRQKFIASFTHEALRAAVLWRLSVLKPAVSLAMRDNTRDTDAEPLTRAPGLGALRCLPLEHLDGFGRPLAVLRVAALDLSADPELLRREVVLSLEQMRVALQRLNERRPEGNEGEGESPVPVLQYVVVVDIEGVSTKSVPVDLIKWYLREIQPWYYGIVGAAFIINYNWAHVGLWGILKHLLPASAIAKIAFPSKEELVQFVGKGGLSMVYAALEDPLDNTPPDSIPTSPSLRTPSPTQPLSASTPAISSPPSPGPKSRPRHKSKNAYPSLRFSIDNPFFGYPIDAPPRSPNTHPTLTRAAGPAASSRTRVPTLRHGRRRKRDLVRALLVLYWRRWRGPALGVLLTLFVLVGALRAPRVRPWATVLMLVGRAEGWVRSLG